MKKEFNHLTVCKQMTDIELNWFGLVSLFNGISTFVGYSGHDVIHTPVPMPSGGFIMTSVIVTSSVRE